MNRKAVQILLLAAFVPALVYGRKAMPERIFNFLMDKIDGAKQITPCVETALKMVVPEIPSRCRNDLMSCDLKCQFGYKLDDNTRCPTCECSTINPCSSTTCPARHVCKVAAYPRGPFRNHTLKAVASCNRWDANNIASRWKHGTCPYAERIHMLVLGGWLKTECDGVNQAVDACSNDMDCPGDMKCCNIACGKKCWLPMTHTLQTFGLQMCPRVQLLVGNSFVKCNSNGEFAMKQTRYEHGRLVAWCVKPATGLPLKDTMRTGHEAEILDCYDGVPVPQGCKVPKCGVSCPAGYTYDDKNCIKCECADDLCKNKVCGEGQRCEMRGNPQLPQCVGIETMKPRNATIHDGVCQPPKYKDLASPTCRKECSKDTDCYRPNQKCCAAKFGCGTECVDPMPNKGKCQLARKQTLERLMTMNKANCSLYLTQDLYVPACQKNGRFQREQCAENSGMCWCVDEHTGEKTTNPVRGMPQCERAVPQPAVDQTPPATCPPGVHEFRCSASLCMMAKCPAYKEAVCRVDPCGGCKVEFYRTDIKVKTIKDCFGGKACADAVATQMQTVVDRWMYDREWTCQTEMNILKKIHDSDEMYVKKTLKKEKDEHRVMLNLLKEKSKKNHRQSLQCRQHDFFVKPHRPEQVDRMLLSPSAGGGAQLDLSLEHQASVIRMHYPKTNDMVRRLMHFGELEVQDSNPLSAGKKPSTLDVIRQNWHVHRNGELKPMCGFGQMTDLYAFKNLMNRLRATRDGFFKGGEEAEIDQEAEKLKEKKENECLTEEGRKQKDDQRKRAQQQKNQAKWRSFLGNMTNDQLQSMWDECQATALKISELNSRDATYGDLDYDMAMDDSVYRKDPAEPTSMSRTLAPYWPQCTRVGLYRYKQCRGKLCWCVKTDGSVHAGSFGSRQLACDKNGKVADSTEQYQCPSGQDPSVCSDKCVRLGKRDSWTTKCTVDLCQATCPTTETVKLNYCHNPVPEKCSETKLSYVFNKGLGVCEEWDQNGLRCPTFLPTSAACHKRCLGLRCPKGRVACPKNPCEGLKCKNYKDAICVTDDCDCKAIWMRKGKVITEEQCNEKTTVSKENYRWRQQKSNCQRCRELAQQRAQYLVDSGEIKAEDLVLPTCRATGNRDFDSKEYQRMSISGKMSVCLDLKCQPLRGTESCNHQEKCPEESLKRMKQAMPKIRFNGIFRESKKEECKKSFRELVIRRTGLNDSQIRHVECMSGSIIGRAEIVEHEESRVDLQTAMDSLKQQVQDGEVELEIDGETYGADPAFFSLESDIEERPVEVEPAQPQQGGDNGLAVGLGVFFALLIIIIIVLLVIFCCCCTIERTDDNGKKRTVFGGKAKQSNTQRQRSSPNNAQANAGFDASAGGGGGNAELQFSSI